MEKPTPPQTPTKSSAVAEKAAAFCRTPSMTVRRCPNGGSSTPSSAKASAHGAASTAAAAAPPATCDSSQNVVVAVRVRRFQHDESRELAIRMRDSTCEVHVPHRGRFPFSFDACFWSNELEDPEKPFASQEDVFERLGRPLVENALAGFNSSIIAYGQTGSGKTYSIFGPAGSLGTPDEGLIPRVCKSIFQRLQSPTPGIQYKVFVSILEVYLEDVFDLLQRRKELKVRGDATGFSVVGLRSVQVAAYSEVEKLLSHAESFKTFAATAIHDRSSRAHTLFQLEVRSITNNTTRTARVVLADLAGSERIKAAQTETGIGFEQAKNINLSLLSLGTCIEAVVSRCKAGQPVTGIGEFRNSTLTKLLKDFLGGNSRTAMLVTIAPSVADVNNSIQALRFADRAKQMTNHAVINTEVNTDTHQLKEEISKMYEKRRELLDRECEIELQQQVMKKKQADLEKASFELMEERRRLRDETERISVEERTRRQRREAEIEAKLKTLQRELAEAETQRTVLDEKCLDMLKEQQSIMEDKRSLSAEHTRLLDEYEAYKNTVTQQSLLKELEHAQVVANLEESIRTLHLQMDEQKAASRARADAVAIENGRKFNLLSKEHEAAVAELNAVRQAEMEALRGRIMSLEEDAVEQSSELAERAKQHELLAVAHSRVAARVSSLDAQLAEKTAECDAAHGKAEALAADVAELSEKTASLGAQLEEALEERDALSEQRDAAVVRADDAEERHRTLVVEYREQERGWNSASEALKAQSQTLEQQYRGLLSERNELARLSEDKESELISLRAALEAARQHEAEADRHQISLRHQLTEATSNLEVEAASHAATRRKLADRTDELEAANEAHHTARAKFVAELSKEQADTQQWKSQCLAERHKYDFMVHQITAFHSNLGRILPHSTGSSSVEPELAPSVAPEQRTPAHHSHPASVQRSNLHIDPQEVRSPLRDHRHVNAAIIAVKSPSQNPLPSPVRVVFMGSEMSPEHE